MPAALAPVDPEQLTPEEVRQLRCVLSVLSLHQLVHLAARVWQICQAPGYGDIVIVIDKGHPNKIRAGQQEIFQPNLEAEKLKEMMASVESQ